ncbi:MAG: flagellin domain protein [Neobacillus sp.]|jgi:flagellin|nr:flagellin domain protein [Neobacillus sp.]
MIINHNIAALNTLNNLSKNTNSTQKSLQKLSSGLRINGAADDAAGLAISEKMKGQIRGLDQASRNAQDASSLLQTAEGALNETHDILQRMRELAVQSSNDTNTDQDRKNIQDEVDQLGKEIDRISNTTQFNTKNLIDGSMGAGVSTSASNINTSSVLTDATATVATTATKLADLQDKDGNSLGIQNGDKITVSYIENGQTKTNNITVADASTLTVNALGTTDGSTADGNLALAANADGSLKATATGTGYAGAINGITITVTDSNGDVRNSATNALSSFTETTAATQKRADGTATFQIGANTGQTLSLSIEDMSAAALGVNKLQVTSQGSADVAIKAIDTATQKVSAQRSKLGAYENRLDHTVNNLATSSQNLTAAQSRITDVDMASEMSNFTKNNILSQAAQAMLAQANQLPQGVLQLLR